MEDILLLYGEIETHIRELEIYGINAFRIYEDQRYINLHYSDRVIEVWFEPEVSLVAVGLSDISSSPFIEFKLVPRFRLKCNVNELPNYYDHISVIIDRLYETEDELIRKFGLITHEI